MSANYGKGGEIYGSFDLVKVLHALLLQNNGELHISHVAYKEAARRGLDTMHFYMTPNRPYTQIKLEKGKRDARYDALTDYKNKRQIVVALMSEKMGLSISFTEALDPNSPTETVMVGDRGSRIACCLLPGTTGEYECGGCGENSPCSVRPMGGDGDQ